MLERILKLCWLIIAVLSDESVMKRSDQHLEYKTEQWKLVEDLVPVLEPFSVTTTFFSYKENVSISSAFTIVYGLLDHLKPKEESTYDSYDSYDYVYKCYLFNFVIMYQTICKIHFYVHSELWSCKQSLS